MFNLGFFIQNLIFIYLKLKQDILFKSFVEIAWCLDQIAWLFFVCLLVWLLLPDLLLVWHSIWIVLMVKQDKNKCAIKSTLQDKFKWLINIQSFFPFSPRQFLNTIK